MEGQMKKFLLITAILFTCGFAYSDTKQTNKGFFWQLKSEKATVYIAGTPDIGSEKMYPLPEAVTKAFKTSKCMVVEYNSDQEKQEEIMLQSVYQGGDTVEKHLSEEGLEKLKFTLNGYGYPYANAKTYRIWYLSNLINYLSIKKAGFDFTQRLDLHFHSMLPVEKKTIAFEKAGDMVKSLNSLPDETLEYFLLDSIHNSKDIKKVMDQVLKLWDIWRYRRL